MNIHSIAAREILDSRAHPTIETEVTLENGARGRASVPSGASVGVHEAVALPAANAIKNVNEVIAPLLKGHDVGDQKGIDRMMCEADGTANKSKLGANAILSVSLACARAAAASLNVSLYKYLWMQFPEVEPRASEVRPPKVTRMMFNILNGGIHGGFSLDVQEFMVVPQVESAHDAIVMGQKIRSALKDVLEAYGITPGVGDEGGLTIGYPSPESSPARGEEQEKNNSLSLYGRGHSPVGDVGTSGEGARISNEHGLQFLMQAIQDAGYIAGKDVMLALDVAASEFYSAATGRYRLGCDGKELTSSELALVYQDWLNKYPIISLEDLFAQDDWASWQSISSNVKIQSSKILIVGDDLFTTNIKRLEMGITQGAANAILIKPNQIGTLTETIECVQKAQSAGMKVIVSHRSGETMDNFIADLAVAGGADYLKSGSPSQPVRMAKYRRLEEIGREMSKFKVQMSNQVQNPNPL